MTPGSPLTAEVGAPGDAQVSAPRPERRLKVLWIVGSFSMGGVETWILELLRFWKRNSADAPEIHFLAASGAVDLFDKEVQSFGSKIFYVQWQKSSIGSFARDFRNILRTETYDAIHDHQGDPSGWHFLTGAGVLPPIRIAHYHNAPLVDHRTRPISQRIVRRAGKELIRSFATHITGTSRQIVTEYGFDAPHFKRIPKSALHCGFDPARFVGDHKTARTALLREFGWPEDSKVVLFAGRMDPSPEIVHEANHKNSGFAVAVAMECARRDPRIRFILAGAPSAGSAVLQERINAAGLNDRILFLGVRKDIAHLMLASDLMCFPSRTEGLGMVAVEAQAAGLPVLVSEGVPHECSVVRDLVRFLPVGPGEVDRWATAALESFGRPRDVSAANRIVAQSAFSIEYSARALCDLYRDGKLPNS